MSKRWSCTVEAPLRADLTGGYTDVEPFLRTRTTRTLSAALLERATATGVRAEGSASEVLVSDPRGTIAHVGPQQAMGLAQHDNLAGLLGRLMIAAGVNARIHIKLDLPVGSGVGTSGAALVAATKCLTALAGADDIPDLSLPHFAAAIERLAGHYGGLQDQLAATVGGLTTYTFHPTHVDVVGLPHAVHLLDGAKLMVPPNDQVRIGSSALVDLVMTSPDSHGPLNDLADLGEKLFSALTSTSPDYSSVPPVIRSIVDCQRRLHPAIREGIDETPLWGFIEQELIVGKPLGGAGRGSVWLILPPVPPMVLHHIRAASWSVRDLHVARSGLSVSKTGFRND
jgi:hypothetical protein